MTRTLLCGLLAAWCVVCSGAAQEKSAKKPQYDPKLVVKEPKVAVVVGVKDYDGASVGFDPLQYSTRDAEELADALRQQGYRIFGDCPKPSTRDDCALTDSMARNNLVKKNLELAVDTVLDGHGTLIFAFSGHGVQQSPHDPQYLALFGANMADLKAATITVDEVEKILERTSARRLLFIDACKTAPAVDTGDGKPKLAHGTQGFYESLSEASGVRIMYSTKNPYPSWEDPNLGGGHGRFSYYLTLGIQGKGVDPDTGLLTFDFLFQYVHEQMVKENERHKDKLQFVTQDGPHDVDFYIAGELKNVAGPSMAAEAAPKTRNRRVLLMGNNVYPQNSLSSAVADARALREQFVSKLGMDDAAITVLTDGTKKQMDQALAKFAASVGPNEDAMVYFSGMGAMAGDEPYITPSDYRLSDAAAGAAVHRGIIRVDNGTAADYENWVGIPVRKILELLSVKPGIRKILIFDMCLTAVKAGIPGWALPPSDGTTAMLFAASPGHEAQETKDHGYFTASMLRLLDENPKITWNEFTGKVWTMTREATHGGQVPFVNGYLRDDFVFEVK
jgi:uncharacterized caspase-like protein